MHVPSAPPVLVPNPLVWVNYPDAFQRMNYPRAILNTLIYAVPSVVGTLLSCSLVAYGFAIIKWPGRIVVFILVLGINLVGDGLRNLLGSERLR